MGTSKDRHLKTTLPRSKDTTPEKRKDRRRHVRPRHHLKGRVRRAPQGQPLRRPPGHRHLVRTRPPCKRLSVRSSKRRAREGRMEWGTWYGAHARGRHHGIERARERHMDGGENMENKSTFAMHE